MSSTSPTGDLGGGRLGDVSEEVVMVGVVAAVAEVGSEAGVGVGRGAGVQAPVDVSVWMLRLQKS